MATIASVNNYWIKPGALSITLNALGPDCVQCSTLAGAVVMAYIPGIISYDAAHNYRQWNLAAYNTYFDTADARYVYIRLTKAETGNQQALITFSTRQIDVNGIPYDIKADEFIESDPEATADPDYWYIAVGEISSSINGSGETKDRIWSKSVQSGTLATDQYIAEENSGDWTKMFQLNKITNLIEVLKDITEAVILKIKIGDRKIPVTDVRTSTDTDKDCQISDSSLITSAAVQKMTDDKFLRKDIPDTANGDITFKQGLKTEGDFRIGNHIPGLLGNGGLITQEAHAELRSLTLWEFLEVPELRYNRVSVNTGIQWLTHGGGIIESVEIDTDSQGRQLNSGIITMHLEDGEIGSIKEDDLCMGIYHNFNGENETENTDARNMNMTFAGFCTVYFRVDGIIDTGVNSKFHYVLRGATDDAISTTDDTSGATDAATTAETDTDKSWNKTYHPQPAMHFAAYANPTDKSRQTCVYATTEYTIGLKDMNTWTFSDRNIYKIDGLLDGFEIEGKKFDGIGMVFGNAYIYGKIDQFERINPKLVFNVPTNGIAYGETINVMSSVVNGYGEDITDEYTKWTIRRESNDPIEDGIWNGSAKAKAFNGTIELTWSAESDDVGQGLSTIYTVTARKESETPLTDAFQI